MTSEDYASALTPEQFLNLRATHAAALKRRQAQAQLSPDPLLGGAVERYARSFPQSPFLHAIREWSGGRLKAAVPAGDDSTWGGDLVGPPALQAALVDFSAPFSVLGRFPGTRTAFHLPTPMLSTEVSASWVGAGAGAPVVAAATGTAINLPPLKANCVVPVSVDLVRHSNPRADAVLRDIIAVAVAKAQDEAFVDPDNAGELGVRPASITYGVSPIASTGEPTSDLKSLIAAYVTGGGRLESAVFMLSSKTAIAMKLWDSVTFAQLTRDGGMLCGIPAICSGSVGDLVVLCDSHRIVIADEKQISIELSQHATLEMVDVPTGAGIVHSSPQDSQGAVQVSLWQSGLVAFKAERAVNWSACSGAVQYVADARYLTQGSPSL
jgi:HK97 family phage major capsid protein